MGDGFWRLLEVASVPILQVLIVSVLGAFMATSYCNLLPLDTRRSLNKIVFMVFTPSLMFASLARTVTLDDIITWWFMPINTGLTFAVGGLVGWLLVKIMRAKPPNSNNCHLEGLVIATCSSGNLGNLLLIVVPAVCNQEGSPFGDTRVCSSVGLSYASFSMALGGFFIWTYTYQLIRTSSVKYKAQLEAAQLDVTTKILTPNNIHVDANHQTPLVLQQEQQQQHQHHLHIVVSSIKCSHTDKQHALDTVNHGQEEKSRCSSFWKRFLLILVQIKDELLAPPTLAAILGFVFGATTWLRKLIVGDTAPLRVVQDSIKLLGDGTIPCITLILGGNLTQGLRSSKIKMGVIMGVLCVRYLILPGIGMWIVKLADNLGFLPPDPLFHYVLMLQFTLPPAMNIGTMTQLFDVGQDECSVLFLWTYLVAAPALTFWSTIYMSNLS